MLKLKIFSKLKKVLDIKKLAIVTLSTLTLITGQSVLCTTDSGNQQDSHVLENIDTDFGQSYSPVYHAMNNIDWIFTPLSGAIAGAAVCGLKCGVLGVLLGAIDESLIHFGYTDKRYLTWTILGIAVGGLLKRKVTEKSIGKNLPVSETLGGTVGILIPTGLLLSAKQGLIDPAVSTATKLLDNGQKFIFPIISNSTIAKPLESVKNYLPAMPALPTSTIQHLYDTLAKLIPEDLLDNHIEKHALVLISIQILLELVGRKIMTYYDGISEIFENAGGIKKGKFNALLVSFSLFLIPTITGYTISFGINDYYSTKLNYALEDEMNLEIFSGETALTLLNNGTNTALIDNLRKDASKITNSGTALITSGVSTIIGSSFGGAMILTRSPKLVVFFALYNGVQNSLLSYVASQRKNCNEKIKALESGLATSLKHDAENIRTITERDGIEITREKIQQALPDLRRQEEIKELWDIANNVLSNVRPNANYILSYYLLGRERLSGNIPFKERGLMQRAIYKLTRTFSWPGDNAQKITEIEQALDHISSLESNFHTQSNSTKTQNENENERKDQINRIYKAGNQIILQELEIGVADRLLTKIEELKLDLGKIYAVTGESGCGKSSLLSKIKGIKSNGIWGTGTIYYPEKIKNPKNNKPKTTMFSQQDYFPMGSSLYEIISYPDRIPSNNKELDNKKRKEIVLLLKEINLPAFADKNNNNSNDKELTLDSKENWYTYLSGGEKKKVMIVSAIIKKPEILILDEIFNGLDEKSTILVQKMLKKHLANTLMLIVDHHAKDNNYNNFYDDKLHFSNNTVNLQ